MKDFPNLNEVNPRMPEGLVSDIFTYTTKVNYLMEQQVPGGQVSDISG